MSSSACSRATRAPEFLLRLTARLRPPNLLDNNFERLYAQTDAEGNVVALVSGGDTRNGRIVPSPSVVQERYHYDPYGRVTFLKPDYTPTDQSQFGFNLLWQAGRRDPLTGVYVGSDGAYHERLGKSLNPEVGMAQGESDFAKNYQRAIDTADPATFALLQPPRKELGWLAEAALFVGSVAVGIGVGLLTANPLLGAMAAGAASNLFDYGARGLLNDEKLSWSGAFQSAAMGAAIGAGTLGVFKLAAFGARLIGKAAQLVYRGGKALLSGARRLAGRGIAAGREFFEKFPRLNPLNYRPRGFYSLFPIPELVVSTNPRMTVIGRLSDLTNFNNDPLIDTWLKSGRIPLIGEPPVTWTENRTWLDVRIARGDLFGIATDPAILPPVINGYIPGTPNGYFTATELDYLNKAGIVVKRLYGG
jgi:hypothetical protein